MACWDLRSTRTVTLRPRAGAKLHSPGMRGAADRRRRDGLSLSARQPPHLARARACCSSSRAKACCRARPASSRHSEISKVVRAWFSEHADDRDLALTSEAVRARVPISARGGRRVPARSLHCARPGARQADRWLAGARGVRQALHREQPARVHEREAGRASGSRFSCLASCSRFTTTTSRRSRSCSRVSLRCSASRTSNSRWVSSNGPRCAIEARSSSSCWSWIPRCCDATLDRRPRRSSSRSRTSGRTSFPCSRASGRCRMTCLTRQARATSTR